MFNFSSVKNLFGGGSAPENGDPMALAKAQAAKAGVAPGTLDDIAKEMKDLAAQGKSQEEMIAGMREIFLKKGFPAPAVDMAIAMMKKRMK